jgi:membrane-associated phospholipid phosphatase
MNRQTATILVAACLVVSPYISPGVALAQAQTSQSVEQTDGTPSVQLTSPTVRGLFADTLSDFRRLPSVESATILSIGAAAAAVGRTFDAEATRSLSTSPGMATAFGAGQTIGGAPVQAAAAVATYTIGRLTHRPKITMVGADLISSQIVAQTTTQVMKFAAGRTRPDGTANSFPSGHSSSTFATATVLQRHFGWKVGIPAYGMATYVAASRIQTKRHFLSDVTFGAALGIVAGRSVTVGHGNTKFALSPSAVPGGGAVSFTWLGQRQH